MRLALAAAFALSLAAPVLADTYRHDPAHTTIRATWDHVGFSDQSLNFREIEGTVTLDAGAIASATVDITVNLAAIDSGVEAFDQHLKSAELFDIAAHPTARFVSTAVEQTGEKTARVTGDLTIKGVTKPVTLEVTLNAMGTHPLGQFIEFYQGEWIGLTATGTVKRSDWGLDFLVPVVSDEVRLFISTEMKAD
jgi:polyisoprenoid-binding protein YceI